jgi:hypothetical protein
MNIKVRTEGAQGRGAYHIEPDSPVGRISFLFGIQSPTMVYLQ